MCGIMGAFSGGRVLAPGFAPKRADLDRMKHRGPDSDGWFQNDHAVLGFRRLSIIDVGGGEQPLFGTDRKTVLTLNGEIYNHRQLRRSLEDRHHFQSRSDAEVLVHRYAESGLNGLLDGVNGMFAFALYDQPARRVILARDRAGQKPLYWSWKGGVLRWASELKALLGVERPAVSPQAVSDYLRFGYVPAPLTMFEGVQKLPAGCLLVCEGDSPPRVQRYWQLVYPENGDRPVAPGEMEQWKYRLREGLSLAVKRRLESEVPMGFLLSGGVDSASVFALGARGSSEPIDAFTIGFPGDEVDETKLAAEVALRWKARHLVKPIFQGDASALDKVIYRVEEPLSTDALLPTSRVFEQVQKAGFTVVLTGEGSDEIMAGYSKFASACSWVEGSPQWSQQGTALDRYLAHEEFCFASAAEREQLLGTEVDDSRFAELEEEVRHLDPLGQMLQLEARLRLPDRINPRLDRLSMAFSIEARAPFMDYELQELCATIPHRLRRGATTDKLLLREAMRSLLPEGVTNTTKSPFRAPARWFVKPELLAQELSAESVAAAGLVSPDVVNELTKKNLEHPEFAQERLYSLYVLHQWHRCFVRQPPTSM